MFAVGGEMGARYKSRVCGRTVGRRYFTVAIYIDIDLCWSSATLTLAMAARMLR